MPHNLGFIPFITYHQSKLTATQPRLHTLYYISCHTTSASYPSSHIISLSSQPHNLGLTPFITYHQSIIIGKQFCSYESAPKENFFLRMSGLYCTQFCSDACSWSAFVTFQHCLRRPWTLIFYHFLYLRLMRLFHTKLGLLNFFAFSIWNFSENSGIQYTWRRERKALSSWIFRI
jgi:hypothetical protein